MPNEASFRLMNSLHRLVLKVSGGRLGWKAQHMPVLRLTTTGRKSGRPHSVMLTSPLTKGTTVVVVASRGGDDRPPAWLLNLQANPAVEVERQGAASQPMVARVATPKERSMLWPQVVADHSNYAGYQAKTTRQIALVLLDPLD